MREMQIKIKLNNEEHAAILRACPGRQVATWARGVLLHASDFDFRPKPTRLQVSSEHSHEVAIALGRVYEALESLRVKCDSCTSDECSKLLAAARDDIHKLTISKQRLKIDF